MGCRASGCGRHPPGSPHALQEGGCEGAADVLGAVVSFGCRVMLGQDPSWRCSQLLSKSGPTSTSCTFFLQLQTPYELIYLASLILT